jgi:hypothetical protein
LSPGSYPNIDAVAGLGLRPHDHLVRTPSAGVLDFQSVKGADTVGKTPAATTPARRSTEGSGSSSPTPLALLITVAVLAASWQDRDGGKTALGAYLSSDPSRLC